MRHQLRRPRDCDSHGNFDGHANCDSDANCHSLRFRQSDTDTQTNPHSETPYDTEAASESAAKAHAVTGQYRLSVVRGPDKRIIITTGTTPIHDRIL